MMNFDLYHNSELDLEVFRLPIQAYFECDPHYTRAEYHIFDPILHIILRSPRSAYIYAMRYKEGRWPEAEPVIMKDPSYAGVYARYIIQGRWVEAEPFIKQSPWDWYLYKDMFKL